ILTDGTIANIACPFVWRLTELRRFVRTSAFLPSDPSQRRAERVARLQSRELTSHSAWQNQNRARGSTSAKKRGVARATRPACLPPSGSFLTSAASRRSTKEDCSKKSGCKPRQQGPPEPSSSTLNLACNRARFRPV